MAHRDIKFRIWNPEREVITGGVCLETLIITSNVEFVCEFERADMIWMQWIGLRDMNNKEIYEGDIIKCGNDIMVVRWNENLASFCLNKDGWAFSHFFGEAVDHEKCEIIGNIHEHPEFLKPIKNET